jgi:multiple sugar transport system substrate-binding protein
MHDGDWDVAFVVTDWLAEAVAAEALLDLAPAFGKRPPDGWPDAWAPGLLGQQRFGDAVYGLPYHDGPECLVYRTDLFADPAEQASFRARHGRDLRLPATWDEFLEVARFFTRPDEGRFGTILAAFPDGHNAVYDLLLQLWSRGGDVQDGDGRVTLDTHEAEAALDFYRTLVRDRTATPPGLEMVDSVRSGELFAAGNIAMMVNWFGFAAVCEQPGCPVKGKVDVAPLPAGPGGGSASLLVYWLLCAGAGSPHADYAADFIRHCGSAAMDKLTTLEGGIGCRRSTWADREVNAAIPFYHRLAGLHDTARELPRSTALPRLVAIIDRAAQAAIATDEPSSAILRRAQAEAADIRL